MIRDNFMQKIILFTLADLHLLLKNNKRKPGEKVQQLVILNKKTNIKNFMMNHVLYA